MDLADHLRTIAANWWRILLIATLLGGGAYVYSRSLDNTYECSTLVTVAANELRNNIPISQEQLQFRTAAWSNFLKSPEAAKGAVDAGKLGRYHLNTNSAAGRLSLVANPTAGLMLVRASGKSVVEACDVSTGFAQGLVNAGIAQANVDADAQRKSVQDSIDFDQRIIDETHPTGDTLNQIQTQINNLKLQLIGIQVNQHPSIAILSPATAMNNSEPVAPHPARDGLLAFLAAFVISAEGFVVARAFSDRFSRALDVESITQLTGLPVLAMVPRGRGPEVVEAFRTLRTNLMFLEGSGRPRTIAIVSPNPGAGKSFCSIHLAESAVAVDAAVVLIDADLRRPVLHQRLRVDREPGLSDVLRGGPLAAALHRVDGFANLRLIPSGSPVSDTVAALGGRAFRQVLDSLDGAELVIVDTPPGAGYADALAVSAQCDAALLLLDSSTTRRRSTTQFIEALERTGASLIGVVLNGAVVSRRDTYERA